MKKSIFGLLFVFVLISSIIPSVFADSYVTITQTSGQTTNPVAIQNSAGTNLFIIDTSGNENYLSTNVAKFSNCGIVLRNTASTFATTICGGAVTANQTLNIPIITGTDTFATLGVGNVFTKQNDFTGAVQKFGTSIIDNGKYLVFPSASTTIPGLNLTNTYTALQTYNNGITMSASDLSIAGNKMKTTNHYIQEISATALGFNVGGVQQQFTTTGLVLAGTNNLIAFTGGSAKIKYITSTGFLEIHDNADDVSLAFDQTKNVSLLAGGKIFFDNFGTNYIQESSTNVFDIVNGGTNNLRLDSNNNIILGQQANLTTSATNGFEYLGQTAGTPTGVPTSITGHSGIVFDGTHNKFCIYNSGWKCAQLS